jgi:hypothetical protein
MKTTLGLGMFIGLTELRQTFLPKNEENMKLTKPIHLLLMTGILMLGCSSEPMENSQIKEIVGTDDRVVLHDLELLEIVGTFVSPHGTCTAFLSGYDEITTAAHCYKQDNLKAYAFYSANSQRYSKIDGLLSRDEKTDLAVFRLEEAFESYLGFGILNPDQPIQVVAAQFESETLLVSSQNISFLSDDGRFTHTADTVPGNSGAPILQGNRAVGVHIGASPVQELNVGVTPDASPETSYQEWLSGDFVREVDCRSNCQKNCRVKTPFGNKIDPVCKAVCETNKKVSCDLWGSAVGFFRIKLKPKMIANYNQVEYEKAIKDDEEREYMMDCVAAATSTIASLGTAAGGIWVGLGSGAAGYFVSKQLCAQSKKW